MNTEIEMWEEEEDNFLGTTAEQIGFILASPLIFFGILLLSLKDKVVRGE